MKHVMTFGAILVFTLGTSAQAPPVEWQRSLGGSAAEELFAIQPTTDGGSVMTGYATSANGDVSLALGGEDLWVVKLDPTGLLQWQRALGGAESDQGRSITRLPDGGYIVGGTTWSTEGDVTDNHGEGDLWAVRLSPTGDLLWQRALGGPLRENGGYTALATSGEHFVVGSSKSNSGDVSGNLGDFDVWIVKLGTTGQLLWEHSFGGSAEDWATGAYGTTDGGVIVCGYTYSDNGDVSDEHGLSDAWLIKLGANGALDWKRTYGGSGFDAANAIRQTADGGYIMAGNSFSTDGDLTANNGGWDMWVQKLDAAGSIQWHRSLGGTGMDIGMSVEQTSTGGYLVGGHARSSNGDLTTNQGQEDAWLIHLDTSGNLLWQRSFGGSSYDYCAAAHPTADGGYLLGGTTFSTNGDVAANNGFADYLVVKFADATNGLHTLRSDAPFHLLPNPVQDELIVELALEGPARTHVLLSNAPGQQLATVFDEHRSTGTHRIRIPVQHLAPGIHHLHVRINDRSFLRTWVKL